MYPRPGDKEFSGANVWETAAQIGASAARIQSSVGIIASVRSTSAATGKSKRNNGVRRHCLESKIYSIWL